MNEIDETNYRVWLAKQPWFVRLDEWQHGRFQSSRLWDLMWAPICALAERHHEGEEV
jgi:hypothetical protein